MKLIASEQVIYESPDARDVYCYSPSLAVLPSGRLAASFDLGGAGVAKLPGPKSDHGDFGLCNQCKVFLSDDDGVNWRHAADLPMMHARLFAAGKRLYLLGHNGVMTIAVSNDEGGSWSEIRKLDDSATWHQAPCAVDIHDGRVYLTMEKRIDEQTWPSTAPVLMSASVQDDLTRRESWTFSNPLEFDRIVKLPSYSGVPFFPAGVLAPGAADQRYCGEPCWLESHVVRIHDPRHVFYDPTGRTVLLLMRCHTGLTNIGTMARGIVQDDGSLELSLLDTPAGTPLVFVNCPGGHMKFHVAYDEVQQLYWLVSTQSTDSMTRPELLGPDRYGLPDNERHRLALYFSKNLFDWCFAGMVAIGGSPGQARHYASMVIHRNDLLILSRSGDERAKSAHNGNLITLHRVQNFRHLIY